ncbi:MAG: hypothetical protein ABWZ76_11710, partial [Acidimicrobiales bacterium]
TKRGEIEDRIAEGRAALVSIEHHYTIEVVKPTTAFVIDRYRNHQVLIDPATKMPIEDDPNENVTDVITLELVDGAWKVSLIEELE